MNRSHISILCGFVLLLGVGCQPNSFDTEPANLVVKRIKVKENESYKTLNIPSGVYTFDNPNLDFNNPDTWTGNVEEFVDYYYSYTVSVVINNRGGTAYDTEVDLYYTHSDGSESMKTIYAGQIDANQRITETTSVISVNTQLVDWDADVFWYD